VGQIGLERKRWLLHLHEGPELVMKALSLTQPWAWIVLHGGKRIENRTWSTRFRGTFLIHASKGMTREQYREALKACTQLGAPSVAERVPAMDQLILGGIVGQATLSHVLPPCGVISDDPHVRSCTHAWHMPEQYGFALFDVLPLPFLECKGALGFWGAFELRDGKAVRL
jgi:hypothetical protein